jgi:hypothetical protein
MTNRLKFENGFPMAGGLNINYVQASEDNLQLARVPQSAKDLVQEWQVSIYPFIGFFQDGGSLHIRTPQEQYEFSKSAANEGLRVLAADEINHNIISMPFLPNAQHLGAYLLEQPADQARTINQLFTDLRNAHAKGFIYGDRCSSNILIKHTTEAMPEVVHIDFDMEISGPTAKELEVAEVIRTILCAGESTLSPLSMWLGAPQAWFNLDTVAKYLSNYAAHWERDRFRRTPGDLVERLLVSAYTIREELRASRVSSLARSALCSTDLIGGNYTS